MPYAPHGDQVDALVQGLAYSDRAKFGWDEKSPDGLARSEAISFAF